VNIPNPSSVLVQYDMTSIIIPGQSLSSEIIQTSRIASPLNLNRSVPEPPVIKSMKQSLNGGCRANITGGIKSLSVIPWRAVLKRPSWGNKPIWKVTVIYRKPRLRLPDIPVLKLSCSNLMAASQPAPFSPNVFTQFSTVLNYSF